MKEVEEILSDFDRAWIDSAEQRSKSIEDRKFSDIDGAQWDGACGDTFKNKPKLTFDKISRELNRINGEYAANPITVNFLPDGKEAERSVANLLNDRFRSDSRKSDGGDAQDTAFMEASKGGFGAFRMSAQSEDESNPDFNEQFVSIEAIQGADAVVVFDPDARKFDKSDGMFAWVLHEFTMHKFNKEYPGKSPFNNGSQPDIGGYEFDWFGEEAVHVAEYYEIIEVTKKRLVFETPMGEVVKYLADEIKENDELKAAVLDYEQINREKVKVREVWKVLMCGDSFLDTPKRVPGEYIPIIPAYGYRSYIKGKEYYMGEVRKQRDRQTFNNMAVSMLAELMTESHKEKPIFDPSQITPDIADMWANNNIDNNPYLLAKAIRDGDGNIQQLGPIGSTSAPQVPPAIISAIGMINQDLAEEMGNGNLALPGNASGVAINQVQNREDMSTYILSHNFQKTMKYAGRVYYSIAKEIYGGINRELRTISEDGAVNRVNLMQESFDQSGMPIVKNDMSKGKYEVVISSGASYSSRLEAERATLMNMLQFTDSTNPMYNLILSDAMQKQDGEGGKTIRKVAKYQELQMLLEMSPSLIDVESLTDDEHKYVQELAQKMQQQQGQQDPMAEMIAQQQQLEATKIQLDAQQQQIELAQKELSTNADAQLKVAQTRKTMADAEQIELENDAIESGIDELAAKIVATR